MNGVLIAAALVAASIPAAAQSETNPSRSTPVALSEVEIVGEVVKVDKGAKTVVVKDPAGKKMKLSVPAEVSSLDDIKPGNLLDMRYLQGVALKVAKPGQRARFAVENIRLAPMGGSEMVVETRKMTGMVTDFDRARNELSLKGPEGFPLTFHVPEGFVDWEQVKVGEMLALQYTEAVALSAGKREGEGASGTRPFDRHDAPITPADRTDTDTRRPGYQPPPNQQPSQTPNQPR